MSTDRVIIAPFFADVDTTGTGTVTYGSGTVEGRNAFAVNWSNVGYFNSQTDKKNDFQLVMIERADSGPGDFDLEFNYGSVQWETGSESGGVDGFGGTSARVGYSNGRDVSFELDGSATPGSFLDANPNSGLANQQRGSVVRGRYRFNVRGGEIGFAETKTAYDPTFSVPTSRTDELGRVTNFALDPNTGNVTESRRVVGVPDTGPGGDDLVMRYTYTRSGLIDTATDALGRVTDYDYDARENPTRVTTAQGLPEQAIQGFGYDAAGNRVSATDPNGNTTQYAYDDNNRLVRVVQPDPDGSGPLTSPLTQYFYDSRSNVVRVVDAEGHLTQNFYDAKDRLVRVVSPDPDGGGPLFASTTQYRYDNKGNLVATIDPLGHTTRSGFDSRNRRTSTTDPDGGVTRFGYDSDDNMTSLTDPVGNVTRFSYDARSRMTSETDPTGAVIRYRYDAADNLVLKTDRNGRETKYDYDDLNRLVRETWLGANGESLNEVAYAYDVLGNLLTTGDAVSKLAYTYDARNRVATSSTEGTPNYPVVGLAYSYDAVGNVTRVADTINGSTGANTDMQFDGLNRAVRLTQAGSNVAEKRVDMAYNALGQYTSLSRYSDLAGGNRVADTFYAYDKMNRLVDLTHKKADGSVIAGYGYTFDLASRITQINNVVDGIVDYSYDNRDQLTGATYANPALPDELYRYDANGNRTESHLHGTGYRTGPANRLLTDGTYNYEYDAEGNTKKRTNIATGEVREFIWDHRNRLRGVVDSTAGGIALQDVRFEYDALNRRISKTVGGVATLFVNDREDVILDFTDPDAAGPQVSTIRNRFLLGSGIDNILSQDTTSGTVWLFSNHLGSIDASLGTSSLAHTRRDTFGQLLPAAIEPSSFGFAGRESEDVDLAFFRNRYYNQSIGIFLSEDKIRMSSHDKLLYSFSRNNPNMFSDPWGLQSARCISKCRGKSKGCLDLIGLAAAGAFSPSVNSLATVPVLTGINDLVCYYECEQERSQLTPKPRPVNDLPKDGDEDAIVGEGWGPFPDVPEVNDPLLPPWVSRDPRLDAIQDQLNRPRQPTNLTPKAQVPNTNTNPATSTNDKPIFEKF